MQGIPILNAALDVEAVGIRQWRDGWLCILITPWFMNIMLLPGDAECGEWSGLRQGDTRKHQLPGGIFAFIAGEEEGLGKFQLFSPAFEFADHATAVATTEAALAEIMVEETPAVEPPPQISRRSLFAGTAARDT